MNCFFAYRIFLLFLLPCFCFAKTKIPTDFILVRELPENFTTTIRKISYNIKDAFEGAKVNTKIEQTFFDIGNALHIKTKQNALKKRLLFKQGQKVHKKLLIETERRLRSESYLGDVLLFIKTSADSSELFISSIDLFSTSIPTSITFPGNRILYTVGILENNLLGYGQQIGFFFQQDLDRQTAFVEYQNSSFLSFDLSLKSLLAKSSDGFEITFELSKPLYSKFSKWGWIANFSQLEESRFFFQPKKSKYFRKVGLSF